MSKKSEKGEVEVLLVSFVRVSDSSPRVSNYGVVVSVGKEIIYRGVVKGHPRDLGWQQLVAAFAEQVNSSPNPMREEKKDEN